MASLPVQTQRFSIKTLLTGTATFAISLALWRIAPVFGGAIVVCCLLFWCGFGLLFASNVIDTRQIDERTFVSKAMGICGALIIWVSILAFVFLLPAVAVEYRNSRVPEYMKPTENALE